MGRLQRVGFNKIDYPTSDVDSHIFLEKMTCAFEPNMSLTLSSSKIEFKFLFYLFNVSHHF